MLSRARAAGRGTVSSALQLLHSLWIVPPHLQINVPRELATQGAPTMTKADAKDAGKEVCQLGGGKQQHD
jgi:hypothetical protein